MTTSPTNGGSDRLKIKPVTTDVHARLLAHCNERSLSNSQIAAELGYSASQVNKYLNQKFEGDLDKIEARIEIVLRTARMRRLLPVEVFRTEIADQFDDAAGVILRTNDFALLHAPAGIGKSCAAALFMSRHSTAMLITLMRWARDSDSIARQFFHQMDTRGFSTAKGTRTEYIVNLLAGSQRPILVDNAHRMTSGARQWLFDFHDATGCPVILIGNPEALDPIRANDQQFSRIGFHNELKLSPAGIAHTTRRILSSLCPDLADALQDVAAHIATQQGHFRALKKHISLTLELLRRKSGDPSAAFRAAHTQLITGYTLPA